MKATLAHDTDRTNPEFKPALAAQAVEQGKIYNVPPTVPVRAGTEIDHPDAWKLVQTGIARPADDECAAACRMTPEQIERAVEAYGPLSKGIAFDTTGKRKKAAA